MTFYQRDTELLSFVISQCFIILNLISQCSFLFPSSPGFLYNQREAQHISRSRKFNFGIAILESNNIIFALKFGSGLVKHSPQQHHIAVCIYIAGCLALKDLDCVPLLPDERWSILLNASYILMWGEPTFKQEKFQVCGVYLNM